MPWCRSWWIAATAAFSMLAVVTYNMPSLRGEGRLESIIDEIGGDAVIIGLQGTCRRHDVLEGEAAYTSKQVGDYLVLQWGHGREAYTNKAAGLATAFSLKKWKRSMITFIDHGHTPGERGADEQKSFRERRQLLRSRAEQRGNRTTTPLRDTGMAIAYRIRNITKKTRKRARRRYANKPTTLSTELSEAWRTRNTHEGYRLAHLMAGKIRVFTVKSDSQEVNRMKEQGKAYNEMVKVNPRHKNGPPHIYQFMGLLTALKERGVAAGAKNHKLISSMTRKYEEMGLAERSSAIKLRRIAKAHDQGIKRLLLVFGDTFKNDEQKAVTEALAQTGAIRRYGRPPAGERDRAVASGSGQRRRRLLGEQSEGGNRASDSKIASPPWFPDVGQEVDETFVLDPWPEGPPDFEPFDGDR